MKVFPKTSLTVLVSAMMALCTFDVLAADRVLRFKAKLDRAALPAGETLADKGLIGTVSSGRLVFSVDQAEGGPQRQPGDIYIALIRRSVAELTFEGAISAIFRGGTVTVQDGQISVSDEPVFCLKCTATGAHLKTLRGDGPQEVAYKPKQYLLMQPAPHKGQGAELVRAIQDMASFSEKHPVKAMLVFFNAKARDPKDELGQSNKPTARLIFTLSDLVVADR